MWKVHYTVPAQGAHVRTATDSTILPLGNDSEMLSSKLKGHQGPEISGLQLLTFLTSEIEEEIMIS